jgi:spectinomycin phosphotransferase
MKTPPPIDPIELKRVLEETYRFHIQAVTFIPRGECSWGYRVEAGDGRAFFLKLFRGTPLPDWAASLVFHLHVDGKIENISHPLPAHSGEVLVDLGGYTAALFDFIEGQTLHQLKSNASVLFHLGETLGRIHTCAVFRVDCRRIEQFDIWGQDTYDQVLAAAGSQTTTSGAAEAALHLLRPVRKRLEALREEILIFQEKARKVSCEFCICHGDPTPGNFLVGKDGTPWLIDWDDLILAPPERDLVFWENGDIFTPGQPDNPVFAGYRKIVGEFTLNPDVIGFYQRQWTVGEIAEYGHRLLFENNAEQQNESDLENLKEELHWMG